MAGSLRAELHDVVAAALASALGGLDVFVDDAGGGEHHAFLESSLERQPAAGGAARLVLRAVPV